MGVCAILDLDCANALNAMAREAARRLERYQGRCGAVHVGVRR